MLELTAKQTESLQKCKVELREESNVKWHEDQKTSSLATRRKFREARFREGNDLSLDDLSI